MNHERLIRLAKFLREEVTTRHVKHFNMGVWGKGDFEEHACGSAACAVGWGSVLFKKEGLKIRRNNGIGHPWYDSPAGPKTLRMFFDITDDQVAYLFGSGAYDVFFTLVTPVMVAERIEKFVCEDFKRSGELQTV